MTGLPVKLAGDLVSGNSRRVTVKEKRSEEPHGALGILFALSAGSKWRNNEARAQ